MGCCFCKSQEQLVRKGALGRGLTKKYIMWSAYITMLVYKGLCTATTRRL